MDADDSASHIRQVVTTDPDTARALENDVRAKILDMLADEAMAVGDIHAELGRRGDDLAETTVRHHVAILREAGLVDLDRLEEAGGGTRKYYRSNTRVFSYDLPEGAGERLEPAADLVRDQVADLLWVLLDEHGDDVAAVAREMTPCEYCETQRYEEFVVRELLDRALTDLAESGELDGLLG